MVAGRMDIAIVGAACRLPGDADSPHKLWRRLRAGDDLVTEVPAERWNTDLFLHSRPGEPGRTYTFRAGVIPNADLFDAGFFGVSPREAEQMDPQQRVLMETAFEAIESAGWTTTGLSGANCAVYVGVSGTEYANIRLGDPSGGDSHFMTGNTLSVVANRLSYVFDLSGPSMAVDTACSSTVAALYEACTGLSEGRFEMALVGAVSLLLSPYPFLGFARASMLAPYGQSRAFAKDATGYVRGEGAGVFALKPLAQALADGDPVRGVIRAVDLNQDGRTNGIALPSLDGQQSLLERIYPAADVDPADLDYFEAHGTGTAVGDPTEAGAIGRALGQRRAEGDPLPIGSVKTNIGHLEPAAGMAGVLKAMLTLEHGEIPPSLHAETLNPLIPFDELNLRVARKLTPLKRRAGAGLVGVNSFGFGGLNGHVIVEGAPRRAARRRSLAPANDGAPEPAPWPLALSAKVPDALTARAGQIADLLEDDPTLSIRDIAYTLWRRRSHMDRRLVARGKDRQELIARLRAVAAGDAQVAGAVSGAVLGPEVKTAFSFSGNGAQWAGMGQALLAEDPAFAAGVRRASDAVAAFAGWSPLDKLAGPADAVEMERTEIAQPLLFSIQVGLMDAFAARGIAPDAAVGHSVGEIAAAFASGALDLEQAARVIVRRSEAQAMTKGQGRMAAVSLDAATAGARVQRLGGRVELAAINSPSAVTLAGAEAPLQAFVDALSDEGVDARMLDLDYAFHSFAMEAARAPLAASLVGLAPRGSRIPFFSAVHGAAAPGETLDADYWWRNIRAPVRFQEAVAALLESGDGAAWTLIEIGPHPILQAYLRQTAREGAVAVRPLGSMARQAAGSERLDRIADEAFCLGAGRDVEAVGPERGDVADLPAYPWRRERYWFTPTDEAEGLTSASREGALLGFRSRLDTWTWDAQIDVATHPFLADHKVGDAVVFPAAGYVASLLEAAAAMADDDAEGPVALEEFEIRRPLILDDERSTMTRVVVSENGRADFLARPRLMDAPWALHARARIVRGAGAPAASPPPLSADAVEMEPDALYAFAGEMGLDYGPAFRPVEALSVDDDVALAALAEPAAPARGGRRVAAPEQIDGAMQTLIALLMRNGAAPAGAGMLPVAAARIVARPGVLAALASARLTKASARTAVADLALLDEDGAPALAAEGVRFQRVALNEQAGLDEQVYAWRMEPQSTNGAFGLSPAKLAAAAKAARVSDGEAGQVLNALDRVLRKGDANAWRRLWTDAPGWSAETALAGALLTDTPLDDGRLEHLLAGGPAFADLRAGLAAALATAADAAPDGRRLQVLEVGGLGGPFAEKFIAEIADGAIDWTLVDDAPDRRARATAAGAEALAEWPETWEPRFDVVLAPCVLGPDDLAQALDALTPGGVALAGAPKPHGFLDRVWQAAATGPAASTSDWKDGLAAAGLEKARSVDAGAGRVWLAARPSASAEAAEIDALPGVRWLVAADADMAAAATAAAKQLAAAEIAVERLALDAWLAPEDLAKRLDDVDVVLLLVGEGHDGPPSETLTKLAAPALAAARRSGETPPRLALAATDDDIAATATIAAFGVLSAEAPDLAPVSLVMPRGRLSASRWAKAMLAALPAAFAERDRAGEDARYVDGDGFAASPRLTRLPLPAAADNDDLGFKPGLLDSIGWRSAPASGPLAPAAIEVEVKAAGVNFRDIMFGLGLLPEEAVEAGFAGATVGMEAAGVVRAVGADVTRFQPGDRVVCVASGCYRDRVVTLESAAARIPDGQDFAAAATLPIVALTAYYSLANMADLGPDDTVLIHGAAGGVGLAAIQYAQHVGARIIATAGSDEKRALLKLLGVELVSDSRSLAFVDDVKRWTDGKGVDVALNSLAGEAMAATLGVMRPFGRFIELGKRDFFENTEIGLKRLRENVSYFAVDADQLLAARPALAARLFKQVEALIEDGVFRPLPFRAFEASGLPDALKWMQRARHVGKVVVEAPKAARAPETPLRVDGKAAYLVVGGVEGFGLETACWLARKGAGEVIMASRRGPDAPEAVDALAAVQAAGAKARVVALDVTDRQATARLVARLDRKRMPLKGVVHAAAVYADGVAAEMSLEAFRQAVAVKADGAVALDAATRDLDLDFFILYSSATTVLGNPGQANYVAGNAAVEAVARARQAAGLPAMAVAWGPIKDTGALKRQSAVAEHLERQLGRPAMAPGAALDLLDRLWASGEAAPVVLDVDWRALGQRARSMARFGRVAPAGDSEGGDDFVQLIAGLDEADARDVVAELIAERVAEVLGMAPDQVDLARPVADLGLDSLMGMELKLSLEERIGVELPTMLLAEGGSVMRIAEKVTRQLRAGAATGGGGDERARDEIDRTLRQHAESLDPDDVEDAISSFRQDSERRRLLQ